MSNYYEILELPENCELDAIKKAYRRLAKITHPDLNPDKDTTQDFIAIEEAYACLKNEDTRNSYNRLLKIERGEIARPVTVQTKYQNDVARRRKAAQENARRRAQMSYQQYQKDDLLRESLTGIIIQSVVTVIVGILLLLLFYWIAIQIYGPITKYWVEDNKSIYVFGATYLLSLIGLSYLYTPFIRRVIIGPPERQK